MIILGAGLHTVLAFAGTVGKGAAESCLGATGRSLSIRGEQWSIFGIGGFDGSFTSIEYANDNHGHDDVDSLAAHSPDTKFPPHRRKVNTNYPANRLIFPPFFCRRSDTKSQNISRIRRG